MSKTVPRLMKVPVAIFSDAKSLGRHLAAEILREIDAAARRGRSYVLGCPGGRSLRPVYNAIGSLAARDGCDVSHVIIAMMDDYVVRRKDGLVCCPGNAPYSCHRFGREEILGVINRRLPPARRIPAASLWLPDPTRPRAYDDRLRAAGGVDLFLTASGASDGHVAFNPPGSSASCVTRIVPLAITTRRDNLGTFPCFHGRLRRVPRSGVTVGLGTIAGLSRRVVLVINGEHKQQAVRRLAACKGFDRAWPASFIHRCRQPEIILDVAAASALKGIGRHA